MELEGSPQSPDEDISGQIPKYERGDRSLRVLTSRFVKLMQESEGRQVDLKEVSHATTTTKSWFYVEMYFLIILF